MTQSEVGNALYVFFVSYIVQVENFKRCNRVS